jgi:YVTN family beta-propeller protein
MRILLCLALLPGFALAQEAAPQRPPTPQKAGVPGVQHPMQRIVPDAEYFIEGSPDWLAFGDDMTWVNSKRLNFVARMDPKTNEVVAKVDVTTPCSGLIIGAGSLWSPSCDEGVLYRIDLETNKTVAKLPIAPANTEGGIAWGAGSVWMPSDPAGVVSRIDPATNAVIAKIAVAPGSFTAIYGFGMVWVSSTEKNLVSVIHPATNAVVKVIPVDEAPRFMAVGEGYVWTLNQTKGTVSKIDPYTKTLVANIEAGIPGTGGEIGAGEGAVWATARTMPITKIDPVTEKVVAQFYGPGGDAIDVGHGSVWLSNGRWSNVWRIQPSKILGAAPPSWLTKAAPFDLDGDAKTDILVEDLEVWFPGKPTTFRMKVLDPSLGKEFQLQAVLNGETSKIDFADKGHHWEAVFTGKEPRWIHYAVCAKGTGMCTPALVTASPTTALSYALGESELVPDTFLAPGPPKIRDYVWNILEPTILDQDYQALVDRSTNAGPLKITKDEDYGELKRHEWEHRHNTAFAWGILTADKTEELACVYVKPSQKRGYDAMVRLWVTKQGAAAGLEPELEAAVRKWIAEKWPFEKPIFPGRDLSMDKWNELAEAEE